MMMGSGLFTILIFLGFLFLLIIGIGLGVYWLFQQRSQDEGVEIQQERYGENHLEVLKRRYASGEISREEYNQMKEDLNQ